ncbi:MAG: hypothetical protein EXR74_02825 [Bdellovibrionales bacterium]|nr:hypothetical protein [Bdellovibrionales bacterium]
MAKLLNEETFYDLLRIGPTASVAEITAAYQSVKAAFSKDSLATYSLMPAEDTQAILIKIETAYVTLTHIDKRRVYDKRISEPDFTSIEEPMNQNHQKQIPNVSTIAPILEAPLITAIPSGDSVSYNDPTQLSLSQIREKKGLTLTDVSRITKIPIRYLKALEEYNQPILPPKVYVQGFLKNLAQLYRLEPQITVSTYFEQLEQKTGTSKT